MCAPASSGVLVMHYSTTGARLSSRVLRKTGKDESQLELEMRAKTLKRHTFSHRPKSSLAESVGSKWSGIPGIQAVRPPTICGFPRREQSGHGGRNGGCSITTQIIRARLTDQSSVWIAAVTIPLMLIAPALWNGYPLLQWDTGGYLARWYEGYLVPSRSTVFGLYLHFGEDSSFWINLGIQGLATLWILQLTLRAFGMVRPLRLLAMSTALILTTALPWLASTLLTDIFAGLSVLSLFILVLHGEKISGIEKCSLFAFTAFAAATHSATLAVLLGLCGAGWVARPLLGPRIAVAGLVRGSLTIVAGAIMLVSANFALSGQLAWTPGGYGVAFGRMLQDGIVARYLRDHCPQTKLKLCPYRDELPATADQFLWCNRMFNTLGRFKGMNDEMGFIVTHSLAEYPLWQVEAAIVATAQQLVHVATGEGTNGWIPHTYGIIERYLPAQLVPMRAAHQQHWDINFAAIK